MRPLSRAGKYGTQFIRQWRVLVLLRGRARTLAWLARELGTCKRTVSRDLDVLHAAGMPIGQIGARGEPDALLEPLWYAGDIPEWPTRDVLPTRELRDMRAIGADRRGEASGPTK